MTVSISSYLISNENCYKNTMTYYYNHKIIGKFLQFKIIRVIT